MAKILIINADDCNLTPGVTQAILDCHDRGILSSTTWMVNLPHTAWTLREIKARKNLGVGIHLNITLGRPVAPAAAVSSLLAPDGNFRKVGVQLDTLPRAAEVKAEYTAQIGKFIKIFGREPTHLDTHHQVHDHPFYLAVLDGISRSLGLPLRRSKLLAEPLSYDFHFQTTDFLLGDLSPAGYWRKAKLEEALENLESGISEIMAHPGKNDESLRAISSFTEGRAVEWKVFSSASLRPLLKRHGIRLSHFGMCYN